VRNLHPHLSTNSDFNQFGAVMNEDRIKGQWKQLAGKLKEKWGKLTDNDLQRVDGSSEYLAGRLQERYGIARDEAKKQIREFEKSL
jgi:uncharacterized protein YjbJ (UPF0337 family)